MTSPYLLRPIRTYEEALREIEQAKEMRDLATRSAVPSDPPTPIQTDQRSTLEAEAYKNEAANEPEPQGD